MKAQMPPVADCRTIPELNDRHRCIVGQAQDLRLG